MKFGAIPTTIPERLALATGKVPVPFLDALYGPIKARVVMAAVRLGVIDALRDGSHTAAEIAPPLGLDADALDLLLRVLVVADYVEQDGERYSLTKLARHTLLTGAVMEMRGALMWNYTQWELIGRLEEVLRSGRGVDFHTTLDDAVAWSHYQRAMLEIARLDAPLLARWVPVPQGATRLLDVAGSHGLLGAAICRRHPPLRSTVVDLPRALEAARALAREAGHADVVEHRPGDILQDDLGQDFDVALLANILHHFQPAAIATILNRVRAALRAGGTVALWELERPKRGSKATDGDGAALFSRITSTGGAYHGDEYAAWLRQNGFESVRIRRPWQSPGSVLITARSAAREGGAP
jgi:2-polyprenyl-3-methyl-5-hydroxy-6-metoxy-1,4-benzoquinol methylase